MKKRLVLSAVVAVVLCGAVSSPAYAQFGIFKKLGSKITGGNDEVSEEASKLKDVKDGETAVIQT